MYADDLAHIHHRGFTSLARGMAPALISLVRREGFRGDARQAAPIVEVGCGSGVLAERFLAAGYDVLGIDRSPSMIRIARATAPGARFRVASLERARLPRAIAVIAIGEIMTYVPGGLPVLARFFRNVRRALVPGGLFIFDFIESTERRTYRRKEFAGDDWKIVLSAWTNHTGRMLTRDMTLWRRTGERTRTGHEAHRIRIYSRDEIGRALTAAGFRFEMRRTLGGYRLIAGDLVVIARV